MRHIQQKMNSKEFKEFMKSDKNPYHKYQFPSEVELLVFPEIGMKIAFAPSLRAPDVNPYYVGKIVEIDEHGFAVKYCEELGLCGYGKDIARYSLECLKRCYPFIVVKDGA